MHAQDTKTRRIAALLVLNLESSKYEILKTYVANHDLILIWIWKMLSDGWGHRNAAIVVGSPYHIETQGRRRLLWF